MANLGFQRVYAILNAFDEIVCERVFWNGEHEATQSVESNRPLRDFDIICFSISFELDYLRIPALLESHGVLSWWEERSGRDPLVLAGGIAPSLNPEPIAPFVDAFLIGEFEDMAVNFVAVLPTLLDDDLSRETRLSRLMESVHGVYVPRFSHAVATVPAFCRHVEIAPMSKIITRDSVFSGMHLVETTRGCGQGCRFCAAGFAYRPPRRWPKEAVLSAIEHARENRAESIGLIGLESVDNALLDDLMDFMMKGGFRLAFSSLRADKITQGFAALLSTSGTRTATIAAEAGSDRLRRVINKRLGEDEILTAADTLLSAGIPNLKMYFMLGLPTEDDEDIEDACALIEKVRDIMLRCGRKKGGLGTLTVSFSTFVPKPFTPFALEGQASLYVLKRRRELLRRRLKCLSNVRLQLDSLREARSQAILSRGDRRLAPAIYRSSKEGFNLEKAVKATGVEVDKYIENMVEKDAVFPWEHISPRVGKAYLMEEYKRAITQCETKECLLMGCKRCGACEDV